MVQPIPAGYHSVTPYLLVRGAAKALDWYAQALGARELMRFPLPGGGIAHAEVMIGDSHVMLADEVPDQGFVGPQTLGGAGVSLMLYVDDVDATFARAVAAGATSRRAVVDQFYGDRSGTLVDPFGHVWTIATHKEDVSAEEAQRRMKALSGKNAS
jgi:PhnB protein